MGQSERSRVQRQSTEGPTRVGGESRTVAVVANDRVARFGEVNANLIASTRFKPNSGQRRVGPALLDGEMRDRMFSIFFLVVGGMPPQ